MCSYRWGCIIGMIVSNDQHVLMHIKWIFGYLSNGTFTHQGRFTFIPTDILKMFKLQWKRTIMNSFQGTLWYFVCVLYLNFRIFLEIKSLNVTNNYDMYISPIRAIRFLYLFCPKNFRDNLDCSIEYLLIRDFPAGPSIQAQSNANTKLATNSSHIKAYDFEYLTL